MSDCVIVGRPVDYLASPLYVNDYHCEFEDDVQYEDEAQPKQYDDAEDACATRLWFPSGFRPNLPFSVSNGKLI